MHPEIKLKTAHFCSNNEQYLKYEKGINGFPLRYFIKFCKLTGSDPKEILELNEP